MPTSIARATVPPRVAVAGLQIGGHRQVPGDLRDQPDLGDHEVARDVLAVGVAAGRGDPVARRGQGRRARGLGDDLRGDRVPDVDDEQQLRRGVQLLQLRGLLGDGGHAVTVCRFWGPRRVPRTEDLRCPRQRQGRPTTDPSAVLRDRSDVRQPTTPPGGLGSSALVLGALGSVFVSVAIAVSPLTVAGLAFVSAGVVLAIGGLVLGTLGAPCLSGPVPDGDLGRGTVGRRAGRRADLAGRVRDPRRHRAGTAAGAGRRRHAGLRTRGLQASQVALALYFFGARDSNGLFMDLAISTIGSIAFLTRSPELIGERRWPAKVRRRLHFYFAAMGAILVSLIGAWIFAWNALSPVYPLERVEFGDVRSPTASIGYVLAVDDVSLTLQRPGSSTAVIADPTQS